MIYQRSDCAWQVPVYDPLARMRPFDYADAFELRLSVEDHSPPEAWLRAGIAGTPEWIRRLSGNRDGFDAATVVRSEPDLVVIEGSDAVMHTTMIGRNIRPQGRMLTTVLRYRRPRTARLIWSLIAPLHRRTARRVILGGVSRDVRRASPDHGADAKPGST